MKQSIKWGLLGLLTYMIFLLAKLPASQVINRLQLPANINIYGVNGSIWQGSAQQLSVNGLPVDNLRWNLGFWPLLTGKLKLQLQAGNIRELEDISFNGLVWLGKSSLAAENFNLYLPTNLVIAQLPLPIPVNANGRFRVKLDELDYAENCRSLRGKGQWLNAEVIGLNGNIRLGNFDADLSCLEGDALLSIKEPNSFGLSAQARVPNNLKISVEGRFKPAPELPQEVQQAAKFFGQPDNNGYYPIQF